MLGWQYNGGLSICNCVSYEHGASYIGFYLGKNLSNLLTVDLERQLSVILSCKQTPSICTMYCSEWCHIVSVRQP